ncbi:c-type cytochrome [Magnetococcales bacterium HHB-1]
MKYTTTALLLMGTLLLPFSSVSADVENGKELHQESCISCHAARFSGDPFKIYTRENRRKKDLPQLKAMVEYCNQQIGTQWFDDDINDVTEYLNQSFYHYKK